ncbi:MAG: hypothetical protein CL398_13035 [Acidiferrobacteraceae bacterium]|nr:hypothetical protein [Acidiferrobacteraceae bacterium]
MTSALYNPRWLGVLTRIVFICAILLLMSCNTDSNFGDLEQFVREGSDRDIVPIEDISKPISPDVFRYSAQDMRDPFEPPTDAGITENSTSIDSTAVIVQPPNSGRERERLEDFALDSLEMVGTMVANKVVWAVIKAPDGTTHRASIGNFLGYNDGIVIHVDRIDGLVEVREIIQDSGGNWQERVSTLRIK